MEASCKNLIVLGLVDSPLKLHVLLLLCRHPYLCGEARSLNDWLHENPWAIEEALDALAEAGLIARVEQPGRVLYQMEPHTPLRLQLDRLAICYDDPFRRDEIYELVRAADRERQFYAWAATTQRAEAAIVW